MKQLKLTAMRYDKVWKFNIDKFCGYVCCDRIRKVTPIAIHAVPFDNDSWLCSCGRFTKDDKFYHHVYYRGRNVVY